MKAKEVIARRVALEFHDGDVVNLGFGIPNASADYIPDGVNVILQAENGALRFGETPGKDNYHPNTANSGGAPITLKPGASTFDIQTSFAIIRGGACGCYCIRSSRGITRCKYCQLDDSR